MKQGRPAAAAVAGRQQQRSQECSGSGRSEKQLGLRCSSRGMKQNCRFESGSGGQWSTAAAIAGRQQQRSQECSGSGRGKKQLGLRCSSRGMQQNCRFESGSSGHGNIAAAIAGRQQQRSQEGSGSGRSPGGQGAMLGAVGHTGQWPQIMQQWGQPTAGWPPTIPPMAGGAPVMPPMAGGAVTIS